MSLNTVKKIMNSLLTLIIIAGVGYASYVGFKFTSEMSKKKEKKSVEQVYPVRTAKLTRRDMELRVDLKADVSPNETVEITPKITGRIIRLSKDDGTPTSFCTKVKAGDVIAVLDQDELRAKILSVESQIETLRAAHEVALVNAQEAQRELERQEKLLVRQAGSQMAYDAAKSTKLRMDALCNQSKANIKQAEATLVQAKINLNETYIRAPFDGIITGKYIGLGSMVTTNTALFQVMDIYKVKSLMRVPQKFLKDIVVGKTHVRLSSELWDKDYDDVVNRIYPSVDELTRTAVVEVLSQNEQLDSSGTEWKFRMGTYIMGSILLDVRKNAIALPVDVLLRQGEYFVFVAEGDTVRRVNVTLGIHDGEYVEIAKGLRGDEEIVVTGQTRLKDGARIRKITTEVAQ